MKANKLLLALPIFFGLVGCAKTTKKVTTNKTTKEVTTASKTTEKKTTAKKTTTRKTTTQYVSTESLNIYCWNSDFQDILNKYYSNVARCDGAKTTLKNGITIYWSLFNYVNYQEALDTALSEGYVDMFFYEPPYAKKYTNSEYVVDMETLGVDQSDQYNFTKDIVKDVDGNLVGSTWYCCPGVTYYNKKVAESVWSGITQTQMAEKLSTYSSFLSATDEVVAAGKQMVIHPTSWYQMYCCNINNSMYDGTNLTVDKNLFKWASDSIVMKNKGGFASTNYNDGLWSSKWGEEIAADNVLCGFSTTWLNDYVTTMYREPDINGDLGLRVFNSFAPWHWNGVYISATKSSQDKKDVKVEVADILSELTTDKTVLRNISDKESYFTNSIEAMTEKGNDDTVSNPLFGGQNLYTEYAKSALLVDASKIGQFDQTIFENFQSAFMEYIEGSKKASYACDKFMSSLRLGVTIKLPDGVTIGDDIVID